MAMIARAFIRECPFQVWGTGEQLRNWTYVSDIVEGTIKAAEFAENSDAVNVGTMEGTRVIDAARMVLELAGYSPPLVTRPEMPTGPYYRIADNSKLAAMSGWRPQVSFEDGLRLTFAWYFKTKTVTEVRQKLPHLLFER